MGSVHEFMAWSCESDVKSHESTMNEHARDNSTSMPTGGAVERDAISTGIPAPLIDALTAATNELPFDQVDAVATARDAFPLRARQHTVVQPARA
jgi:hypothetical protein